MTPGEFAWDFFFGFGFQGSILGAVEFGQGWAWAVRQGDVAAAPEPAGLLLFEVGALALGWSCRRR